MYLAAMALSSIYAEQDTLWTILKGLEDKLCQPVYLLPRGWS